MTSNSFETPMDLPAIQSLLKRAQAGDREAVPALRTYLDGNPNIWRSVGDLAAQTEKAIIATLSGNDLLRAECLERKLAALKAELAGPTASPVEKLIAARAALSWLQVHSADLEAMAVFMRDGGSSILSVYAQRRLDSANRRYLQTLRSLEVVRRLQRPRHGGRNSPKSAGDQRGSDCVQPMPTMPTPGECTPLKTE